MLTVNGFLHYIMRSSSFCVSRYRWIWVHSVDLSPLGDWVCIAWRLTTVVNVTRWREYQRKTRRESIEEDRKNVVLSRDDAQVWNKWKSTSYSAVKNIWLCASWCQLTSCIDRVSPVHRSSDGEFVLLIPSFNSRESTTTATIDRTKFDQLFQR